eukprot:7767808-Pyramimonas_sp.AAC.1
MKPWEISDRASCVTSDVSVSQGSICMETASEISGSARGKPEGVWFEMHLSAHPLMSAASQGGPNTGWLSMLAAAGAAAGRAAEAGDP